jgi:hypothetical protein
VTNGQQVNARYNTNTRSQTQFENDNVP